MSAVRRHDFLLAIAALIAGGCAGNGCAGCNLSPLPAGGLPADQTLEGGAQIRVTPQGFAKITTFADDVLNDALAGGMCLPDGSQGILIGDIEFCQNNDGTCTPGCKIDFHLDDISFTPLGGSLRVRTQFDIQTDIPVQFDPIIGGVIGPCTLNVTANNNVVDANVVFGIRTGDGELTMALGTISDLTINPSISGCSFVGGVLDFVANLVADFIGVDFITELLRPTLSDLVAGFLPDPLGVEGTLALGDMLGAVQPDVEANLETRVVPGGYVALERGGMSLGMITGFNADEDPATRAPGDDNETALCVPRFAAPDFTAVPLPKTTRQTFALAGANLFRGQPEPAGDLAIGISDTFLDLVGHHLVGSGGLCLGMGTAQIPQLNVSAIGIFVPSLAELASPGGGDPLLLVTRPVEPIGFTIGDGTEASPSLTVHIKHFEIDFYAFLFERYTRAFTMSLDLDVGLNLEFTTDASGAPAILPVLTGLSSDNVGVTVLNAEFLREDKATLEDVLPSVLDIALNLLDDNLAPIALPDFAGFSLSNLATQKVTTSEDDFLAITATLAGGPMMMALADRFPSVRARLEAELATAATRSSHGAPRLVRVDTPAPAVVREALAGRGGRLPEVELDLPVRDDAGQPLEWTWSIGGGLRRPFGPGGRLVIRDRSFAFQGHFDLHLEARVAGDYRTLDREPAIVPVVIDSVGPRILSDEIAVADHMLAIPAVDLVSPPAEVQVALGAAGAERPATTWTDGRFAVAVARDLAGPAGELTVFARDALGNETVLEVELEATYFHGKGESGCNCGATGGPGAAGAGLVIGLAALLGLGRRRLPWRRLGLGLGFVVGAGALPACSCSDSGAATCEIADECAAGCDEGQIPLCLDGMCLCQDELVMGQIGVYSEMAVTGSSVVYVSAYNRSHGDLMIAAVDHDGRVRDDEWQFVDGVPEGPIVVEGSSIRGGIAAPGDDVGLYTDVDTVGESAVVSYFDQTHASLKFASNVSGRWALHSVDLGQPGGNDDQGYEIVGRYSSITVAADGHPGIAYFAEILSPTGELTTELRFAEALSATPASAADWQIFVVDSAAVEPPAEPDPLPIPPGTGLFAAASRLSDGRPVVAYYDRVAGDLEVARFLAGGTGFEAPTSLDGADGADVGWYPALFVDSSDELHVSYVSASNDDLLYVNTIDATPEVIDDGYRLVGQTEGGLPKPEFHLVGDDSALVLSAVGPYVAYQDATSHELLAANKGPDGTWRHRTLAGAEDPFVGGYGFFTSADLDGGKMVVSNWVLDQPNSDSWVEILRTTLTPIE